MYDLDTTVSHLDQFLAGASVTLLVSAQGALLGVALGFGLLLLRAAPWRAVRWIARAYVSFIRGTPLLVQICLSTTRYRVSPAWTCPHSRRGSWRSAPIAAHSLPRSCAAGCLPLLRVNSKPPVLWA